MPGLSLRKDPDILGHRFPKPLSLLEFEDVVTITGTEQRKRKEKRCHRLLRYLRAVLCSRKTEHSDQQNIRNISNETGKERRKKKKKTKSAETNSKYLKNHEQQPTAVPSHKYIGVKDTRSSKVPETLACGAPPNEYNPPRKRFKKGRKKNSKKYKHGQNKFKKSQEQLPTAVPSHKYIGVKDTRSPKVAKKRACVTSPNEYNPPRKRFKKEHTKVSKKYQHGRKLLKRTEFKFERKLTVFGLVVRKISRLGIESMLGQFAWLGYFFGNAFNALEANAGKKSTAKNQKGFVFKETDCRPLTKMVAAPSTIPVEELKTPENVI
ncbi:hypothetical protein ANN_14172 [Periplaneta americana]|uniref:Uncharacterized protein n=1 Tax=Periplaneta americana TaxID=6978 RepID=A0ABQ8SW59_PERAM|nr:hypothetical protein ANN_14172 [Periplaneta americana]